MTTLEDRTDGDFDEATVEWTDDENERDEEGDDEEGDDEEENDDNED